MEYVWAAIVTVAIERFLERLRRWTSETWEWFKDHLERGKRWAKVVMISARVVLVIVALVAGWFTWDRFRPPSLDACGRETSDDAVEVMVEWENDTAEEDDEAANERSELNAFCDVVLAYTRADDGDVEVESVGENVGAELDERLQNGDPPDVGILPQPSLVRQLGSRGDLLPIEEDVADRLPCQWNEFVRTREGGSGAVGVYGAFVKGAHKSLFWYRPVVLGNAAGNQPERWTWEQLRTWTDRYDDDEAAPMVLAAHADGDNNDTWTLTDWFENELAARAPEVYSQLARGVPTDEMDWDAVRQAWRDALGNMAQLWERSSLFPPGAASPRQTRWEDLASRLTEGHAEIAFGPSFLANQIDEGQLYPFGFPAVDDHRPLVVGGDIAVIPTEAPHTGGAQDFVRWLTDADAIDEWGDVDDGYLTPNDNSPYNLDLEQPAGQPPPDNEDNLRVYLTHQLVHPPDQLDGPPSGACADEDAAGDLLFDLSDDQLSIRNEGNPHRNWDVFAEFFHDITSGGRSQDCAIEAAIQRLQDEYEGAERWRPRPC